VKPGEKVTLILSLHGAGSSGNWQRHYFPLLDYKDKYRLVIATPTAATAEPTRVWVGSADDEFLQHVVTALIDQIGKQNVKAFWLVGHSQGPRRSRGWTANLRLLAHLRNR
jgi:pimeloyl-ACP methyl ester carboxylesterase